MFRLSRYLHALTQEPGTARPTRPNGPVVIWNLIRRCNLTCRHCYTTSTDRDFPGELTTLEALAVLQDLRAFQVPAVILSGGEPLLREDLFEIAAAAKALGFFVALSSNGTLMDQARVDKIASVGFDYVGVSLDGLEDTHDRFRQRAGAFRDALAGIRKCRDLGLKVGLRFTLTQANAADLPALLALMQQEHIDKFYLSHLNYAGRGGKNRRDDASHAFTRNAMETLFDTAWTAVQQGRDWEFVTGNNDADGVFLLHWLARRAPDQVERLTGLLRAWGGNASGRDIANIDTQGHVHPDTFWSTHTLGNVKERPFSVIWQDLSDPLLAGLRTHPRPLEGRCGTCGFRDICNGNTRTRAFQTTGRLWAEDPGCYLTDEEICV